MRFVVLCFYENEPCDVYGVFDTEASALEWAQRQAAAVAWSVHGIKDVEE